MRYTTPEWLLENLERRLRLAMDQHIDREQSSYAGITVPMEMASAETSAMPSVQSAS